MCSTAQTLNPSFYGRATTAADRASALTPPTPRPRLAAKAAARGVAPPLLRRRSARTRAPSMRTATTGGLAVLVDAQVEQGRYGRRRPDLADVRQPQARRARALTRVLLHELHGDITGARSGDEPRPARPSLGPGAFQQATLAAYDGDLLWGQGRPRGRRRRLPDSACAGTTAPDRHRRSIRVSSLPTAGPTRRSSSWRSSWSARPSRQRRRCWASPGIDR